MTRPTLGVERGNTWSTQGEHNDLWAWTLGQQAVTRHQVAVTRESRSIRMYTYGDTSKPTLLLIGGQHGNEPSGREVLLWLAREMSDTSLHADALQYGAVAIIPDANPDGRAVSSRENSVGVDPNRDHLTLEEVEAQAINEAIRDLNPVMALDLHEYGGEDQDVWIQAHLRDSTHPQLAAHGDAAYQAAHDASVADGYDTEYYPFRYRLTFNGVASLMHMVGVLSEVRWRDRTRPERFESQKPALHAVIDYFRDHAGELAEAQRASKAHASQGRGPDLLDVWADQASIGGSRPVHMDGYTLDGQIPQDLIDAHGITVDGTHVPIRQTARGIIPELIDPDLDEPVTAATRVGSPRIPTTAPDATYVQIDGTRHAVTTMVHQTGGQRRTVSVGMTGEEEPELLTNGLFRQGLDSWYEYGSTSGTYEAVAEHDGKRGAVYFHGDGTVRLETVMLLDRDGGQLNLTAETWVPEAGMRPGQVQLYDLDAGSTILTPISPEDGELDAGWNTVHGSVSLGTQGRTNFALRIAQINDAQTNPAYWRITEATFT